VTRRFAAFVLLAAVFVSAGSGPTDATAAELTVLSSGAFNAIAQALRPSFESQHGATVTLRNDTNGALVRRITGGEASDVALLTPASLDQLIQAGRIVPGSTVRLARVGIGVGVRTGARMPDISTVAGFRRTMLEARTVAFIDPAAGGSSGIYIAKLFETMGIADRMAAKSILVQGGLVATRVVNGEADIGLQQISELMAPGINVVGPLPAEIQNDTVYAGAVAAASKQPELACTFLAALAGPAARPVLAGRGMSPP